MIERRRSSTAAADYDLVSDAHAAVDEERINVPSPLQRDYLFLIGLCQGHRPFAAVVGATVAALGEWVAAAMSAVRLLLRQRLLLLLSRVDAGGNNTL